MNSAATSPTPAGALLRLTLAIPNYLSPERKGKPKLLACVPSWNELLGMAHWARAKRKTGIQDAFLSALRASAADSSTKTTSARNTLSIAAGTLASYQQTRQTNAKLKQLKKRLASKKKKELS